MSMGEAIKKSVKRALDVAAGQVAENSDLLKDPAFLEAVSGCIHGNGDLRLSRESPTGQRVRHALMQEAVRSRVERNQSEAQRDQLLEVLRTFREQLESQPRPARVTSGVFPFGSNGTTRPMLWVEPIGPRGSAPVPVCLADAKIPEPVKLSLCYIDSGGRFYLQGADDVPLSCEESPVVRVDRDGSFGLSEVVITEGPERQVVLRCDPGLAEAIDTRVASGHRVTVRHDHSMVIRMVDSEATAPEDWLEFPDLDGPPLEDLIFPNWLMRVWQKDVHRMVRGRQFRVLLIGPTGTGKSEAVERAARKAAKLAKKQLAIIRISLSRIGSIYHSQSEQNIRLAAQRAGELAKEGYLVVVVVDECDALLGNSEGRFESSVNRSVRNTFQSEFSNDIENVFIYMTMNVRADSWLPAPIGRRFRKRVYPPARRGQIARVAASYTIPQAMKRLKTTADEFGRNLADYLYADSFVVARVFLHSGNQLDVRARNLRDLSPAKIRDLVIDFCEDILDGEAESTYELWPLLEREFRGTQLNEANLYQMTFLEAPANDTVRKVEMLRNGLVRDTVRFARPR